MPTTFQLGGGDALELWSVSPSEPHIESFGLSDAEPETVWRVDLPDDEADAEKILLMAQAEIDVTNEALDTAQAQMAAFNPRPSGSIESFGIGSETGSKSETELRALLYGQSEIASFGVGDDIKDTLYRAVERFEEFAAWVRDAVGVSSRLETRVGGRLIAVTRLSITGNLRTFWLSTDSTHAAKHDRALKLMLESRAAMLRTVTMALGGAIGLAGLVMQPAGLIRAVPAAFKFIEDVRAEYKQLKSTRRETTI